MSVADRVSRIDDERQAIHHGVVVERRVVRADDRAVDRGRSDGALVDRRKGFARPFANSGTNGSV